MYCKYCGKNIDNDSIFCKCCGKKIIETGWGGGPASNYEGQIIVSYTGTPGEVHGGGAGGHFDRTEGGYGVTFAVVGGTGLGTGSGHGGAESGSDFRDSQSRE